MTSLLDLTDGKRFSFESLNLPSGLIIGMVIADGNVIHIVPPCPETRGLSVIFVNDVEQRRFIFTGRDETLDDEWLGEDGFCYTASEIADLPLQLAAQHIPLTKENLRRFDS